MMPIDQTRLLRDARMRIEQDTSFRHVKNHQEPNMPNWTECLERSCVMGKELVQRLADALPQVEPPFERPDGTE